MVNILDCGSKTGSCVCSGLGLLGEAGHGKFDSVYTYSTDRQASGCEKLQDPTPEVGKAQSEVSEDLLELARCPQACTEAEDDRFSGSWTLQVLLDAVEELRIEWWWG